MHANVPAWCIKVSLTHTPPDWVLLSTNVQGGKRLVLIGERKACECNCQVVTFFGGLAALRKQVQHKRRWSDNR